MIEYEIVEMGTGSDWKKRHALEDRLKETLGWTGLGDCDGGSIASGMMEVCCFAVDVETGKRVIKQDSAGTEFRDYAQTKAQRNHPAH